jgi:hypothetical protein
MKPSRRKSRPGIDQTAGDFTYDVNYEFDAGTGLSEDRSATSAPSRRRRHGSSISA